MLVLGSVSAARVLQVRRRRCSPGAEGGSGAGAKARGWSCWFCRSVAWASGSTVAPCCSACAKPALILLVVLYICAPPPGAAAVLRGAPAHGLLRQPAHRPPAQPLHKGHGCVVGAAAYDAWHGGRLPLPGCQRDAGEMDGHSFPMPTFLAGPSLANPWAPHIQLLSCSANPTEAVDVALQGSVQSFLNCSVRQARPCSPRSLPLLLCTHVNASQRCPALTRRHCAFSPTARTK